MPDVHCTVLRELSVLAAEMLRRGLTIASQFLYYKETKNLKSLLGFLIKFIGEFDPGSGRTLAACLTHASRTELRLTPISYKMVRC